LADIYALAGRNDEAIALISGLLKSRFRFTPVTPIMLRLAPTWDLLREEPRFQALLKEYLAEVRLRWAGILCGAARFQRFLPDLHRRLA
jgi:hypothetical protein